MKTKILFLALFTGGIHAASWPTSKMYLEVSGGVSNQECGLRPSFAYDTNGGNGATYNPNGIYAGNDMDTNYYPRTGETGHFGGIWTGSMGYDYLIPSCSNFVLGGFLGAGYSRAHNTPIVGTNSISTTSNPTAATWDNTSKETFFMPLYIQSEAMVFTGIRLGALVGKWLPYVKVGYIGQGSKLKLSYLQNHGILPGNNPVLTAGKQETEEYRLKGRKWTGGVLVGAGIEGYITPSWVLGVNGEYHMFPSKSVVLKNAAGNPGITDDGDTRYIRPRFWTNRWAAMITLKYILPVFGNNLNN